MLHWPTGPPSGKNRRRVKSTRRLQRRSSGMIAATPAGGALPLEFPTISLGEVFLSPTSFVIAGTWLTIPAAAPHPQTGIAFVRFIFSPEGQAILKANGFIVLPKPLVGGPGKPPAGLF